MTLVVSVAEDSTAMAWNAWVSLATAFTCFAFALVYTLLARWWTTYEGRVMTGKAVAIGLLALYTFIVVEVAPESSAMRWARVGLVAVIGMFMIFQTARLVTNQLNRNKHRRYNQ